MSNTKFNTVAILGPGLLGGSLGMAVKTYLPGVSVIAWARRKGALQEIMDSGAADDATDCLEEAVRDADLVILATPVGVMPELARSLIPFLKPGALVSDVGSVKCIVHVRTGRIFTKHGIDFIGSHPMAGSEKEGIGAAHKDLFQYASLILTNDEQVAPERVDELERFWELLGCSCYRMEAEEHDRSIAQISHMTHILAALASQVGLNQGEEKKLGNLSGGGFRDTSRVSSGNPDMWAEILVVNREALTPLINQAIEELRLIEKCLEGEGDSKRIRDWLEEARRKRALAMEAGTSDCNEDSTV